MKKRQILTTLTIALGCASLTSCGLITSAAKVPGSLLKSVARTVGMPVNHVEESAPTQRGFEVVGDGVIDQLD